MLNKLYGNIIKLLKDNYKFIILMIVLFITLTLKLPFYINAPGGLIDTENKIEIENSYTQKGTLNMTYVSELQATIPTYLYTLINKDWKIINEEEIKCDNETYEDSIKRSDILLKESVSNAIKIGYNKANKDINIIDSKVYITYILDEAETDLKIGDQILKINDKNIINRKQLSEIINNYKENDSIEIIVLNEGKEYKRQAKLLKYQEKIIIGVTISEVCTIETSPKLTFNYDAHETGPSGGLMLTLTIYNKLTENDITKGYKIAGTGTIDQDGNIGSIGGVEYKLKGAINNNSDVFIVPTGENHDEVIKLVKENNYKIKIIEATTFDSVIEQLHNL